MLASVVGDELLVGVSGLYQESLDLEMLGTRSQDMSHYSASYITPRPNNEYEAMLLHGYPISSRFAENLPKKTPTPKLFNPRSYTLTRPVNPEP